MRKYLLPILLIGFWGCEDSEEPQKTVELKGSAYGELIRYYTVWVNDEVVLDKTQCGSGYEDQVEDGCFDGEDNYVDYYHYLDLSKGDKVRLDVGTVQSYSSNCGWLSAFIKVDGSTKESIMEDNDEDNCWYNITISHTIE